MISKSRVLVVDDDPMGCRLLRELLSPDGYDVLIASDGRSAVSTALEMAPDLILLDVMMPGMDGFDVCRILRADPKTTDIPILFITALDDKDSFLRGIEAGADDFISKPINRITLRARVRTILRLDRYRRLTIERIKFERVVERSESGYLLITDEDEIAFANPKARFLLGVAEEAVLLEPFLLLARRQYHCEPQEAWENWPQRPLPDVVRYLVQPETPTARSFWLQADILDYLETTPKPLWIVCLKDVTNQMNANRDMRKFHTMVYHKLRTPLINMLGGLELLALQAETLSPADVAQFANIALKGARGLFERIEEVIQYVNAPTMGRSGLGFQLTQLPELVQKICRELGIEMVVGPEMGMLTGPNNQLALSEQAMELILWAVLENAQKFHPRKSPYIWVSWEALPDGGGVLRIADDGQTLSPEQLVQVWTPYYQGEKHFTGQIMGMGLGLSMVAVLLWSVNGRCQLHNRLDGPGVVVELTIPPANT